jgi:hypothetical protein
MLELLKQKLKGDPICAKNADAWISPKKRRRKRNDAEWILKKQFIL